MYRLSAIKLIFPEMLGNLSNRPAPPLQCYLNFRNVQRIKHKNSTLVQPPAPILCITMSRWHRHNNKDITACTGQVLCVRSVCLFDPHGASQPSVLFCVQRKA